ncbi:MAG TPA: DUF5947 family protein [Ktedonobacteraceae bacterium]|nr:DUF5947 family protein [Ktedonobacteraceae bacterium]
MSASSPANDNNGRTAVPMQALRQFTQERKPATARPVMERCELCSETIAPQHRHLLELSNHTVLCACNACSLLFGREGAAGGKYRLLPQRYLFLPDFHMTEEQWDALMIPVNMVYIFRNTPAGRVTAFYPGPAGATESLLNLENWEVLAANNPILNNLEPDVEALLINRVKHAHQYYIVPIDACYQLVGMIRMSWRGLSGGEQVWKAIDDYFTTIRAKSQTVGSQVEGGSA